ncbi:MAG TPA: thioredoxin family protein [Cytophagaceae bacterium]
MKTLAFALLLSISSYSFGQGYNVGDKVADFSLSNSLDNSQISLGNFAKSKSVVIVFSSPACPYVKLYEDRLVQLANDFASKEVRFLFINPNNSKASAEDSPAEMAKRAREKNYSFPYLVDNAQVSSAFGASKTPEVFVLKNINGSFVLQYKGAIDDNPQVAADVTNSYLKEAINSILTNSSMKVADKRASGCMIKK